MCFNDSFRDVDESCIMFICNNQNCRAIFQECSDGKGKRRYDKDRWFEPDADK